MTEQERNAYREDIIAEDKHSRVLEDDLYITKLVYAMMQTNDIQMNLHWELERALGNADVFHRSIKQKCKELKKMIHDNSAKMTKSGRPWSNLDDEQLDAVGTDNSILELLIKKFFGLSRKVAFFGGVDIPIGQKKWAISPASGRAVLVMVCSATATVECDMNHSNVAKVMLHCVRLNEKTASETKDRLDIDSMMSFDTKEAAREWLKSERKRKQA